MLLMGSCYVLSEWNMENSKSVVQKKLKRLDSRESPVAKEFPCKVNTLRSSHNSSGGPAARLGGRRRWGLPAPQAGSPAPRQEASPPALPMS